MPLIVGGGIRDPQAAKAAIEAGADIIVTGTIVERDPKKTRGNNRCSEAFTIENFDYPPKVYCYIHSVVYLYVTSVSCPGWRSTCHFIRFPGSSE